MFHEEIGLCYQHIDIIIGLNSYNFVKKALSMQSFNKTRIVTLISCNYCIA
jgi:hypothetical protein